MVGYYIFVVVTLSNKKILIFIWSCNQSLCHCSNNTTAMKIFFPPEVTCNFCFQKQTKKPNLNQTQKCLDRESKRKQILLNLDLLWGLTGRSSDESSDAFVRQGFVELLLAIFFEFYFNANRLHLFHHKDFIRQKTNEQKPAVSLNFVFKPLCHSLFISHIKSKKSLSHSAHFFFIIFKQKCPPGTVSAALPSRGGGLLIN